MNLTHFVFTRFCISNNRIFSHIKGDQWYANKEVLNPEFFIKRCKLLKLVAIECLKNQISQNFKWIIVVDRNITLELEKILYDTLNGYTNAIIYKENGQKLDEINWLKDLIPPETEYLITTLLDDDDAFPRTFIEAIQDKVKRKVNNNNNNIPLFHFFGNSKTWQWNYKYDKDRPLGTRSDWHRKEVKILACGFTLASKLPVFPKTILGLKHSSAIEYSDFNMKTKRKDVLYFRKQVYYYLNLNNIDPNQCLKKDMISDMGPIVGSNLMSNHGSNDEVLRLFQNLENEIIVKGPETFPNLDINWELAPLYLIELGYSIESFKKRKNQLKFLKYYYKIMREYKKIFN